MSLCVPFLIPDKKENVGCTLLKLRVESTGPLSYKNGDLGAYCRGGGYLVMCKWPFPPTKLRYAVPATEGPASC
jgi:hypothetical protein